MTNFISILPYRRDKPYSNKKKTKRRRRRKIKKEKIRVIAKPMSLPRKGFVQEMTNEYLNGFPIPVTYIINYCFEPPICRSIYF